mgnify:CR=1 FL=1
MSFIGLIPLHLYFLFFTKNDFKKSYFITPIIAVFLLIFTWYSYVGYYNNTHNKGVFLQGLLPIWDLNSSEIKAIAIEFYHKLVPSYFNITGLFTLLVLLLYSVLNYKRI